ncbi:MAG TPA: FAD-dependent oxidoreductase [Streptosporangiaceae bacterium]|nr:FAD-dependent oxidoreductase [Streptosporangiaceae bacterium]
MAGGVTRRHFLTDIGVAGGAGMLYATMGAIGLAPTAHAATARRFMPPRTSDFTLTGRRPARVLVLGAGIAGLTTAYELGKAGYDCHVLEAMDRPGGRNWTVRRGTVLHDMKGYTERCTFAPGQYLNPGPARIAQWMVTLEYCRELGVPIEMFANQNADAFLYNENVGPENKPVRWRTAKADVYGYVAELLAKATDQGALDAELTPADKERILEFLKGWGAIRGRVAGNPAASWLYTGRNWPGFGSLQGLDRRGYKVLPGAGLQEGTGLMPIPSLSAVFASKLGLYFDFEFDFDQAMPMFQPVGGMDRIPYALAAAIGGGRISYGAVVRRVTNLPDRVEVVYADTSGKERRAVADFCVATLPPNIMARIPNNLGSDVAAALRTPFPLPVGKLGLEYKRRWWETDDHIYGGITNTSLDVNNIWYPSHGFHEDRGVVLGYYNFGPIALSYGRLAPPARTARAVAQGVKIHGGKYRTELASSFSVPWHSVRYIEGGWVGWPKQPSAQYRRLLQPTGRVYMAGDWLSFLIAWQAGAFDSARRTVGQLHSRVLAS